MRDRTDIGHNRGHCADRTVMTPGMQLAAQRHADDVILTPVGRIDHTAAEGFRVALAPWLDECRAGGTGLVLDFGQVDYISSAGLRVLMLAAKHARTSGGRIVVAALQPVVTEIFAISHFDLVLQVYESVAQALDHRPQPGSPDGRSGT